MYVSILIGSGMVEISKTNPDNMIAGKNATTIAACAATNWFLATVEIYNPKSSAENKKIEDTMIKTSNDPRKGT